MWETLTPTQGENSPRSPEPQTPLQSRDLLLLHPPVPAAGGEGFFWGFFWQNPRKNQRNVDWECSRSLSRLIAVRGPRDAEFRGASFMSEQRRSAWES